MSDINNSTFTWKLLAFTAIGLLYGMICSTFLSSLPRLTVFTFWSNEGFNIVKYLSTTWFMVGEGPYTILTAFIGSFFVMLAIAETKLQSKTWCVLFAVLFTSLGICLSMFAMATWLYNMQTTVWRISSVIIGISLAARYLSVAVFCFADNYDKAHLAT